MPIGTIYSATVNSILPGLSFPPPTDVYSATIFDSTADDLTGDGSTVRARWNRFTTAGAAALPAARAGMAILVCNSDPSNLLNVSPASTEQMNGIVDASFAITSNTEATFRCFANGAWFAALSN